MGAPPDAPARRLRAWKLLLSLVLLAVLAEGAGFVVLWKLRGARPSGAWVTEQLRARAGALAEEGGAADEGSLHRGPEHLRREVLHPYVGYLPRSSARIRLDDGVWLNDPGFDRPDSPIHDEAEDSLVVGITGGSVAGLFAQHGRKELASQLALHPSFEGKRVRFVVLAFGGYKQPQQLMALSYLLALGGHLDLLVNIDGFNEVTLHASGNALKGVDRAYPRDWFFRAYDAEVATPMLGELAYVRRQRAHHADAALHSPLRWSWTRRALWSWRDRDLARAERALEVALRAEPVADPRGRARAHGPEALAAIWRDSSLQLHRLCVANGIDYYHVLQPNQYVEGSKPLSAQEREVAIDREHVYGRHAAAGYAALRPAGEELLGAGVAYADLTGVFAEQESALYIDDCCHFNELGNQLLARAIGEFVLAHTE